MKAKVKLQFSLTDQEKTLRELSKNFKMISSDPTLIFLLKQHSRTHYVCFVFLRLLDDELTNTYTDTVSSIMYNAVDYLHKNVRTFLDIISSKASPSTGT